MLHKIIATIMLAAIALISNPVHAVAAEGAIPPADITELVSVSAIPPADTTDLSDPQPAAIPPAAIPPADTTDLSTNQPTTPSNPNQGGGSISPITPGAQTGGGGTSFGFSTSASTLPSTQSVLGASTGPTTGAACKAVITKYMKLGDRDAEVAKLQVVLNSLMGKNLVITGVYDNATFAAVSEFQKIHASKVLKPWVDAGLMESQISTGYAYITTVHTINSMLCGGNYGPLPTLK